MNPNNLMTDAHDIEIRELREEIQKLSDIIKPLGETYCAAVKIGRWASGLLVFIAVGIGVVLSFKELFRK